MNGVAVPVLGQHHKGSFQPGGMRHVVDFGASGLRLAGAAPKLAQTPAQDWLPRAKAAVQRYDELLKAASTIANDDARGRILTWIGRADIPGSPAERYGSVNRDIGQAQSAGWESVYAQASPIARDRVSQFESQVTELSGKVSSAIATYGVLPASSGAGSKSEVWDKSTLCVAGGIALLALVVIPMLLD